MNKLWTDDAWNDYIYWSMQDKKTLKRINQLLKDIDRNQYDGIGKPDVKSQVKCTTFRQKMYK